MHAVLLLLLKGHGLVECTFNQVFGSFFHFKSLLPIVQKAVLCLSEFTNSLLVMSENGRMQVCVEALLNCCSGVAPFSRGTKLRKEQVCSSFSAIGYLKDWPWKKQVFCSPNKSKRKIVYRLGCNDLPNSKFGTHLWGSQFCTSLAQQGSGIIFSFFYVDIRKMQVKKL